MSVWPQRVSTEPLLSSHEGQLVTLRVAADARRLEDLLEALAELTFPVNPQILHHFDGANTAVEFPAFDSRIPEVRQALESGGFPGSAVEVRPALEN